MLRKTTLVAMGILLACASVLISVPTAFAASHDGDLRMKGPANSAYTQSPFVSLVGAEGATLTWTIQVVNKGSAVAQFLIRTHDFSTGELNLYDGTLLVKPLASGPDGYYTRALAPGGSQVLTAKMTIPFDGPKYEYYSSIELLGTDNVHLDEVGLIGEQTNPVGNGPHNLAVKSGSQKPVGNGNFAQAMTAGTITPTGTAVFSATIKNNSRTNSTTFFKLYSDGACGSSFAVTVKQGTTNVTAAAIAGSYSTGPLAPGQSRTLTISMKATSPCAAHHNYWRAVAGPIQGSEHEYSTLLVNIAG